MRLIDADGLDDCILKMNNEGSCITRGDYKIIDRVIFEMPTVEAIPIAWIEERMEEYDEDRLYASSMILEVLITAWKRKRKEE